MTGDGRVAQESPTRALDSCDALLGAFSSALAIWASVPCGNGEIFQVILLCLLLLHNGGNAMLELPRAANDVSQHLLDYTYPVSFLHYAAI